MQAAYLLLSVTHEWILPGGNAQTHKGTDLIRTGQRDPQSVTSRWFTVADVGSTVNYCTNERGDNKSRPTMRLSTENWREHPAKLTPNFNPYSEYYLKPAGDTNPMWLKHVLDQFFSQKRCLNWIKVDLK